MIFVFISSGFHHLLLLLLPLEDFHLFSHPHRRSLQLLHFFSLLGQGRLLLRLGRARHLYLFVLRLHHRHQLTNPLL